MYTVMISDDGMFSAEYVQPPALSIPLGISGSTVEIRRNEDLTFSAMIGGEWMMITAETTVTAENGNVYAAQLSPEGVPIGVMHVAAMQEVMLGALGGTVTLTQAEDMTWWLGEAEVKDGYVHTAANGNMYVLMMEEHEDHHDWVATYQPVMVMVALGTQGSIELVRAEDMSWWLGSEGVGVGSEVMSDNGNTYTLWYTDGAWTARFEPAMMEIQGTGGVMVYSREADDMYDVESVGSGMTLAADGAGEITTSAGAMYRVMMMDGMLSGTRFDDPPVADTIHLTVGLTNLAASPDGQLSYIPDNRNTAANEANTKLTVAGQSLSLGDLLGSGMAAKPAKAADGAAGEFVKSAVELLMDLRTEAELYLKQQAASDDPGSEYDERLTRIANRAQDAVNMIFGNDGPGNKRQDVLGAAPSLPREANDAGEYEADDDSYIRANHTVRGLNRLLDALSSADAFVAATAGGNNGVFEGALGEDDARNAFSANKSEYTVYFGTTENTRYGAIAMKERKSADPDVAADGTFTANAEVNREAAAIYGTAYAFDGTPTTGDRENVGSVGAFSYSRTSDTLRARMLSQTGSALYTGGTVAVTPGGKLYSGDMRIDVNFRSESVFGRVSDLRDKDNSPWQYLGADVATIFLPRQTYDSLTQFGGLADDPVNNLNDNAEDDRRKGDGPFGTATVVYAGTEGLSTPTHADTKARFAGRFIGEDGGEITGTWSLGQSEAGGDGSTLQNPTKSNDLDVIYGSYGVTRQGDSPVGATMADGTAGGAVKTTVFSDGTNISIAGDKDVAGILRLGKRNEGGGTDANNDYDLKKIFAQPGADPKKTVNNSPTHVTTIVNHIEQQREIYMIYSDQVGGDSDNPEAIANQGRQSAWESINNFVRQYLFGLGVGETDGLQSLTEGPVRDRSSALGSYTYPKTRNNRPDDAEALERIDNLLAALADQFAFEDATEDNAGGVFDSTFATDAGDGVADPFKWEDDLQSNLEDMDNTIAAVFARRASQTQLFSLSTDYTRFGVWYRRETDSAAHNWNHHESPTTTDDGTTTDTGATSPSSYAYSWLSQSSYRTDRVEHTYPGSGLATYEGRTLALLKNNTHIYIGDALIRVKWESPTGVGTDSPTTNSTVLPIFSNFRKWQDGSFDRLVQGGKIVDEIVFRASGGSAPLPVSESGGNLMVNVADAQVTLTYTDGTDAQLTDAGTFNAKFVGSGGDGPLGLLGTWKAPGVGGATSTANDLVGSFGADLTSFETLLP